MVKYQWLNQHKNLGEIVSFVRRILLGEIRTWKMTQPDLFDTPICYIW